MLKISSLSRRHFVYLGISGLAGAMAVAVGKNIGQMNQSQALDNQQRDFKVSQKVPLKERAAAKGLIYGAAISQGALASDSKFAARFAHQCGMLAPDIDLKWDALRPAPNKFDFTKGDWLAKFARTHGMLFRGHTLVWHDALPNWFEETANSKNAEKLLRAHIATVTKHYAGQMHSWDVVNEAIETDDGRDDGLKNTPWLKFLGPDYIELAFRVAAEGDPEALLVYNENGLENDVPKDEKKRTTVLKLLERLKSKGTPIHGLGIQSHLFSVDYKFNPKKLRKFLADVASLGLKILITELDVEDQKLPVNLAVRDGIIASIYEDYLSVVLDEPAVIAVVTWGLTDRGSWLKDSAPRSDREPVRPLPLDSNLNLKLAWNAIARAFDHAPKR